MSRIDLVSNNLLANFFRNSRKRKIIEKKLCPKITYKYSKSRKNNKCNKIPDLERKEAERFQRAKNILVTFAIFADISGPFLASSVSKSSFFLDLLFLRFLRYL